MATKNRVRHCDEIQAKQRLDRAREFLEVADLVSGGKGKDESPVYASAAASLAILAGIAASDAACCKALRERSRSENHRDAMQLLGQIVPGGTQAAKESNAALESSRLFRRGSFSQVIAADGEERLPTPLTE